MSIVEKKEYSRFVGVLVNESLFEKIESLRKVAGLSKSAFSRLALRFYINHLESQKVKKFL
jgi:hypothetical protein